MPTSLTSIPTAIICFFLLLIFLGASVTFLLARIKYFPFPYTVVIFTLGVLIAFLSSINKRVAVGGQDFTDTSIVNWEGIHPDVILYVFLPPLLFGEALSLNYHHVKQSFMPSLLAALPGAAFAAYAQGIVVLYLLPDTQWSWLFCFTFGAVLCATDPVSVVATLKSVAGSSTSTRRLTYFITGEALLNDGSAIVIFDILTSNLTTVNEVVIYFVKVIFISPLIGAALGLGAVVLLRRTNRRVCNEDHMMQIIWTLACAYTSFFLAQYTLGVSGVISCCTAGIVLSRLATPLIFNQESLHVVWGMLEWLGNTMIFMVAGMVVASQSYYYVTVRDIEFIFIIYATMFAIRFVMLLVCFPFVRYFWWPEHCFNDVIFSCFAGLRGAISLTCALSLLNHIEVSGSGVDDTVEGAVFSARDVHRAVFIICGVVTLTIVLNGSLSSYVLSFLDITPAEMATDEKMIHHYIKKRIRHKSLQMLVRLQKDLPTYDPDFVKSICSLITISTPTGGTTGGTTTATGAADSGVSAVTAADVAPATAANTAAVGTIGDDVSVSDRTTNRDGYFIVDSSSVPATPAAAQHRPRPSVLHTQEQQGEEGEEEAKGAGSLDREVVILFPPDSPALAAVTTTAAVSASEGHPPAVSVDGGLATLLLSSLPPATVTVPRPNPNIIQQLQQLQQGVVVGTEGPIVYRGGSRRPLRRSRGDSGTGTGTGTDSSFNSGCGMLDHGHTHDHDLSHTSSEDVHGRTHARMHRRKSPYEPTVARERWTDSHRKFASTCHRGGGGGGGVCVGDDGNSPSTRSPYDSSHDDVDQSHHHQEEERGQDLSHAHDATHRRHDPKGLSTLKTKNLLAIINVDVSGGGGGGDDNSSDHHRTVSATDPTVTPPDHGSVHSAQQQTQQQKQQQRQQHQLRVLPPAALNSNHNNHSSPGEVMDQQLVIKFRRVFLEILRRAYLKQIINGRIPRGSAAALTLLHSIDVGLDTCHTPGFQDWDLIRSYFETSRSSRLLSCIVPDNNLSSSLSSSLPSSLTRFFKERLTADMVYVLTSFIEAHKYAQYHLPFYLGEQEWPESPEEFLILEESNEEVRAALDALAEIPTSSMMIHVSRQAARMVLCMQEDLVSHFIEEGILSAENADYFIDIIHANRVKLHSVRTLPHHQQEQEQQQQQQYHGRGSVGDVEMVTSSSTALLGHHHSLHPLDNMV